MLREFIAISGKPGLYKIVSHSANRIIAEDMQSKKRFPVSQRDKVISLADVAMYTNEEDKPLGEIFQSAFTLYDGKGIDLKQLDSTEKLSEEFAKVLPDFARDRVYPTDIKKFFSWYNILVGAGMTEFVAKKEEEKEKTEE